MYWLHTETVQRSKIVLLCTALFVYSMTESAVLRCKLIVQNLAAHLPLLRGTPANPVCNFSRYAEQGDANRAEKLVFIYKWVIAPLLGLLPSSITCFRWEGCDNAWSSTQVPFSTIETIRGMHKYDAFYSFRDGLGHARALEPCHAWVKKFEYSTGPNGNIAFAVCSWCLVSCQTWSGNDVYAVQLLWCIPYRFNRITQLEVTILSWY